MAEVYEPLTGLIAPTFCGAAKTMDGELQSGCHCNAAVPREIRGPRQVKNVFLININIPKPAMRMRLTHQACLLSNETARAAPNLDSRSPDSN